MDPRLVAHPSFSAADRGRFVMAVGKGLSRSAACREVGVSYGVFLGALRTDPAFCTAVEEAEAEKWDLAETALLSALRAEEPWAVKFVLERGPARRRWEPPASRVDVAVEHEVGPGVERIAELQAAWERRKAELAAGSVLDLESTESVP